MNRFYAGVGSRQTPTELIEKMKEVAFGLASLDWVLRSGGAEGADKSFEQGCDEANGKKEIYYAKDATPAAFQLAKEVHPAWYSMSPYAKKLHARNCFQILGRDLKTPCRFVLCWTKDGADGTKVATSRDTGGTGQAIRIAARYHVPVINMFHENWEDQLEAILAAA